jgi:hypothetical protein
MTRFSISPKLRKWIGDIFLGFCGLLVFTAILSSAFPAGLDTISTRRADALLFASPGFTADLPDKVEITIDGVDAVFHRGEKSYDQLVTLLHNGRTQDMLDATGGPIGGAGGAPCGEMVIRSYGITSRFRIERAALNKDIYWIWLPHLNRGGYAIPFFTADPRVIDLIKTTGIAH